MKKLLLAGLTLTAAGMLAACGGGKADQSSAAADSKADTKAADGETAISLWTYPVGKWGDAATVEGIVKKFNEKQPEITVTGE